MKNVQHPLNTLAGLRQRLAYAVEHQLFGLEHYYRTQIEHFQQREKMQLAAALAEHTYTIALLQRNNIPFTAHSGLIYIV
jgi:hypothetical protein